MARMLRFECEIPDGVFDEHFPEDLFVQELKEEAIMKLFTADRISSGYAARLLGVTRREFFDLLHQQGMPFAQYTEADFAADLEMLRTLKSGDQEDDSSPQLGD